MKSLADYLYYHEPGPPDIKIYCGDCLEIMPLLSQIDLVITDIPFNVGWNYEVYKDNLSNSDYVKNMRNWFSSMNRFNAKCIVKFPTKFSFLVLPVFNDELTYEWTIIQSSPNTTSHGSYNLNLYTQYVVSKHKSQKRPNQDLFVNTKNNITSDHPAEMPTMPIKKLANMFLEDGTILDPFLGSGTTLVACKELKRNGIGIEINEKYCEIAKKRLQNTIVPFI